MKLKESPYYDKELLGSHLYKNIDNSEVFTILEFFNMNDNQKEYLKEGKNVNEKPYSYKLKVFDEHYELDCKNYDTYLYLVFDKPVHITGKYCTQIIVPEIVVKCNKCCFLSFCVAKKVVINNGISSNYEIFHSKFNNVYFYNSRVSFWKSEINNFFIFSQGLVIGLNSHFLDCHKIKCFGACGNLKERISEYRKYKKGIIHIE